MKSTFLLIKHYDHESHEDVESLINPMAVVGVQDTTIEEELENGSQREIIGATIRFVDGSEIFLRDDKARFVAEALLGFTVVVL